MLMPPLPRRWWVGEWQPCSSSCGPGGLSRRAVLCVRSVGLDEQSALEPPACAHLPRPPAETPCNRNVTCPATWAVGNWSQVSIRWEGWSWAVGRQRWSVWHSGGRDLGPSRSSLSQTSGAGMPWHATATSRSLELGGSEEASHSDVEQGQGTLLSRLLA